MKDNLKEVEGTDKDLEKKDIPSDINNVIIESTEESQNILNGEKKLEYAKETLWEELYETIWKKYILDEWMTIDKIDIIPYSISKEQIIAMWIKNLVNKKMTTAKIEYVWSNMSIDDIVEIWQEELLNISIVKLVLSEEKYNLIWELLEKSNASIQKINNIEKKITTEQIIALWINNMINEKMNSYRIVAIWKLTVEEIKERWWNNLTSMPLAKLILQEEKYNALMEIIPDVDLININYLNSINNRLSAEQIIEIWWDKLLSMNNGDIINYNSITV